MVIKQYTITVSGRVQGVFFRATTKQKADELSISGFARNEPDGEVFIKAEGSEENLQSFIAWCHHGPPRARVDQCIITESVPEGLIGFTIRH